MSPEVFKNSERGSVTVPHSKPHMSCPFAHKSTFSTYKGDAEKIMASLPDVLDQKTLDVVNATAPAVVAHIEEITSKFYPHMFSTHPCTKNYFNLAHQVTHSADGEKAAQPFALAHAIVRYVGHLNDRKALRRSIELAAQKHCALNIRAQHYPIVYECFMWAVAQVLGAAVTPEVADAWGKVVLYIARAMIERELEIYEEQQAKDFDFDSNFAQKFVLTGKRRDTDLIYTFIFSPVDGTKLPHYEAGQYITLRLHNIPGAHAETTLRHYSVSTPPGEDSYAISVQVVPGHGVPQGLVSNYLRDCLNPGDEVELGMPFGTLKLNPTNNGKPIALISGGIGCTVTVSMLSHICKDREFSKIYFAHSLHDGGVHAYRNRVSKLRNQNGDKLKYMRIYSKPRPVDKKGVDYDVEGHVSIPILEEWMGTTDLLESQYILCGPEGLVRKILLGLLEKGVPRDAIQFECFGPLGKTLEEFVV